MALTSGNADAAAQAFCTAQGIVDASTVAVWKLFWETMYAHLKTDIGVTATVPTNSIVTTGSSTTQTGPASPVATTVVIS